MCARWHNLCGRSNALVQTAHWIQTALLTHQMAGQDFICIYLFA